MMEKKVKIEMNAVQIIYGMLTVIGFVPGLLLGMIFDAPGSDKEMFRWCIFLSYPCFVLTFILTAVFARILYQRGQYKIVRWLNVIPVFWFLWAFFWFYYWDLQG
ncbi:hypothetical protein ACFDTO_21770 [Microbacteriaceae bacterium 4G12]